VTVASVAAATASEDGRVWVDAAAVTAWLRDAAEEVLRSHRPGCCPWHEALRDTRARFAADQLVRAADALDVSAIMFLTDSGVPE
jgi:hypothetical protein